MFHNSGISTIQKNLDFVLILIPAVLGLFVIRPSQLFMVENKDKLTLTGGIKNFHDQPK